jgi:hypothetical protein
MSTRKWLLLCGLLMACDRTPKVVRDLPELPAELAKDLAPARTAPVLMTKPAPTKVVPPPVTTPLPLAIARACTSVWEGYVIYPMTVCYWPFGDFQLRALSLDTGGAPATRKPGNAVPPTRFFKYTAPRNLHWFCSVRGGPWYAHVEGKQVCGANPNIRAFTAEILGAPEPVVVTWTGDLANVPPPLQLVGLTEKPEECVCCSGVTCPDGSCKPKASQCGGGTVPPPALQ